MYSLGCMIELTGLSGSRAMSASNAVAAAIEVSPIARVGTRTG